MQDVIGHPHDFDPIIDTGFSGYLTLPSPVIAALGLPWLCRQHGILADGTIQILDVFTATANWEGRARLVEVDAVNAQSLLGMSMLQGHELWMEVVSGGNVRIRALP